MGRCTGTLRGICGLKNLPAILSGTAGHCCIDACAVQQRWLCTSTSSNFDPFKWMEHSKPSFFKHVARKEVRARKLMSSLQPLQKDLLQQALASLHPEQRHLPEPSGSYEYWTMRCMDAPKPVLLRRALRSSSRPEVLLDANEDPELCEVECWGQVKISPNGRRIAFTVPAVRGAARARAIVREIPTASCGLAGMWDLAEGAPRKSFRSRTPHALCLWALRKMAPWSPSIPIPRPPLKCTYCCLGILQPCQNA
mmetsp:Transcript_5749/g.16468  ORF Transcript_5749/g.16468 Transcript_5749/m.16468 type:complete len:253 (-) Transcript_5749:2113-2871(-)